MLQTMDLSKYDALDAATPDELKLKYHQLRARLELLNSAPTKDMKAIDAVIVELDEVQAGARDSQKRDGDTQRF